MALRRRTGPHANWCHFATWASKQAGQTIRREDLARALERALASPAMAQEATTVALVAQPGASVREIAVLQRKVWDAINPLAAIDRASDAVARGNLKVFAEIGHEFARFIADCLSDIAYDPDQLKRFCAALRPGDASLCFGAGVAAFMLGQNDVAQRRFECALALDAGYVAPAVWLVDELHVLVLVGERDRHDAVVRGGFRHDRLREDLSEGQTAARAVDLARQSRRAL